MKKLNLEVNYHRILSEWRNERALHVGHTLSKWGLGLSVIGTVADLFWSSWPVILGDFILLAGFATSFLIFKLNRKFYWQYMIGGFWLSALPSFYYTGGVKSPFFGIGMALIVVVCSVIQTKIRPSYLVYFAILNFVVFLLIDLLVIPLVPEEFPPVFAAIIQVITLIAMYICISAFLRTEKSLASEISKNAKMIHANKEELDRKEAANAAKSSFIANVSHELRTPLGAILGYTELISQSSEISLENREHLKVIDRNAQQLFHLVNDLLDLSKVEAGKLEMNKAALHTQQTVGEIISTYKVQADKKGIALRMIVDDQAPELLLTDSMRFRQILTNMVGNSLKFTESGFIEVKIGLDKTETGEYVVINVTDTGLGMSESEQEKLFYPFSQGDSTMSRKFGGAGLGLFLSKKLARLLDGELTLVCSELGQGSQFALRLPAIHGVELKINETTPFLAAEFKKRLQGKSVLVVDDLVDNQNLIQAFSKDLGLKMDFAQDGQEGVSKALEGKYDLILMDMQMPVLDGYQATSKLREKNYSGKIIALTAHAMLEDRTKCIEAGCNDYLSKPVNKKELIDKIQYMLEV